MLPGLVDLHTHLREPGREDAETVETGSAAAALGGYTAVFAMPNTDPTADTAGVVEQVYRLGRDVGLVDVFPIGAVTVGRKGERLAELGAMANSAARVRVFSDDGDCVSDALLMRRALEYVKAFDGVIAQHAQEPRLTQGAQMHEGEVSARLGLTGWPAVAEEAIIARDCLLTDHVGSRLHVCHLSTAGSVEVVAAAKKRGTTVTAEVTPHHLLLTDERAVGYDPVFKVNPPLRTAADVDGAAAGAGRRGDRHRRHRSRATCQPGQGNRVGQRQSRHARPADGAVDRHPDHAATRACWTGAGVARVMSEAPARIGGLTDHGRPIAAGEPANLVLIDPAATLDRRRRVVGIAVREHPVPGHGSCPAASSPPTCAGGARCPPVHWPASEEPDMERAVFVIFLVALCAAGHVRALGRLAPAGRPAVPSRRIAVARQPISAPTWSNR